MSVARMLVVLGFMFVLGQVFVPAADASSKSDVYLTYDDGPGPYTGQVLDVLKKHNAKATFFVTGAQISQPGGREMLRRIVNEGHSVANHTWSHPKLTRVSYDRIVQELDSTTKIIQETIGLRTSCFRPPYGATNATVWHAQVATGHNNAGWTANYPSGHLGGWDVDTNDWRKGRTVSGIVSALDAAGPGDVILMHDGGGYRARTVVATDLWLAARKHRFNFATLPGCEGRNEYCPNDVVPTRYGSSRRLVDAFPQARSDDSYALVGMLYKASLGRVPDMSGYEYWVGMKRSGMDFSQMAEYFGESAEFETRYGCSMNRLSPEAFALALYRNVLNREPDSQGYDYWVDVIKHGADRAVVLTSFASSDENRIRAGV